jgi:hypothetical protein
VPICSRAAALTASTTGNRLAGFRFFGTMFS